MDKIIQFWCFPVLSSRETSDHVVALGPQGHPASSDGEQSTLKSVMCCALVYAALRYSSRTVISSHNPAEFVC